MKCQSLNHHSFGTCHSHVRHLAPDVERLNALLPRAMATPPRDDSRTTGACSLPISKHVKFWKLHLSMLPAPYVRGDDQR